MHQPFGVSSVICYECSLSTSIVPHSVFTEFKQGLCSSEAFGEVVEHLQFLHFTLDKVELPKGINFHKIQLILWIPNQLEPTLLQASFAKRV